MTGTVAAVRDDAVVLVGLRRPETRNALDEATVDELHAVLDAYRREPAVLAFHSEVPGTFVSGADIAELRERGADDALRAINAGLFDRIEAHRWPTIAAVDGPAYGGGCELALACDLRVASTPARFAQPEPSRGIIAGAGANWRLPQLVGTAWARRMLFLGDVVEAETAASIGLVDRVCEPEAVLDEARTLAKAIAERSWRALELTKLALRLHRPATTSFDLAAQALLFETDEKRERMSMFLQRRPGPQPVIARTNL